MAGEAGGAAEAAGAGAGAAETAGATSEATTASRDFNDSPVGKMVGSKFGKMVTADVAAHGLEHLAGGAMSAIGTGPNYEHVDIGSMGNV